MSTQKPQKPWYKRPWVMGAGVLLAFFLILALLLEKRPELPPAVTAPASASPSAALRASASPSSSALIPSSSMPRSSSGQVPSEAPENGQSSSLVLISVTSPVSRNQTATISVRGAPDAEYQIAVYYSSGKSTAAGLENKTSGADGMVSWNWKVGGSTNPGTYRISVTGGGDELTAEFTVE